MRNPYYTGAYSLPSMFSPASRGWQQQAQPSLGLFGTEEYKTEERERQRKVISAF
jgi:hypothetical protein